MSNDRGLFQPRHTWGLRARRKPPFRLGIRKAALTGALAVAVVVPAQARLEQSAQHHVGEQAQATAALQQMQAATVKQAEAVLALQHMRAQEAALKQAQEEADRQEQALALQQQAQAQAAAQQQAQAQAAALQQKQAQEAAARQAQEAAQRQVQAQAVAQRQVQKPVRPAADFLSPVERSILNTVNQQRAAAGLPPLQPDYTLVATARAHSAQMRDSNRLFHTTDLSAGAPPKWRTLGENVAVSTSVDAVNARFMASSTHRANILGGFDRVGIGVVVAGGRIWVTQEFLQSA